MSKVLVEVYVPSANMTYDAYIPLESKIEEVAKLLADAITDLAENKYKRGQEVIMCDFTTGKEYDKKLRVFETDINNGSKIIIT